MYTAIEDDPSRVASAIEGDIDLSANQDTLDVQALQGQMDPDPADVKTDLENLCDQMRLSSDSNINDVASLGCP